MDMNKVLDAKKFIAIKRLEIPMVNKLLYIHVREYLNNNADVQKPLYMNSQENSEKDKGKGLYEHILQSQTLKQCGIDSARIER